MNIRNKWYKRCFKCNKEALKRDDCKAKDIKQHTWCTYKHLSNMYDCVYNGMVETGAAVTFKEKIIRELDRVNTTREKNSARFDLTAKQFKNGDGFR
jgi:hypothetical protein